MLYYHGSPNRFDTFDYSRIRTNGTSEGVGFYFTDNKRIAEGYGSNGYLYTVRIHGKKALSDNQKTMSRKELEKYITELHKHTDFLSNYGEVDFEGYETVLNRALESEYEYNDTDSEILGSIYNAVGENQLAVTLLNDVLGYDHIAAIPDWGNNQNIIVALVNDIIEHVEIKKL